MLTHRRIIEVNQPITLTSGMSPQPLRQRALREFAGVPRPYLDVARKLSSPLLSGPPLCDELIAFVQHLLTEEEAAVMRHLGGFRGRSAAAVAKAEHRPVEQIEPILNRLALEKRCIACTGPDHARRYQLMPLIPGVFEMVLIGVQPEAFTPWHQRFVELFEAVYRSGYLGDYSGPQQPSIRFVPLAEAVQPSALPATHLEPVLERYKTFAIGQCQCRMAMNALGHGCGRTLGNCTLMGTWAEAAIHAGWARKVSGQEVRAIKAEAESQGLVSWVINVDASAGQASCSCCGCCCHAMRVISEFNTPGWIAPPRYRPAFDDTRCTFCGQCQRQCPMAALRFQPRVRTRKYLRERCIGCGLCALACPKSAVKMEPARDFRGPFSSSRSMLLRSLPDRLRIAWNVWRRRARGTS